MSFFPSAAWLKELDEKHQLFTERLEDPLAFEGGQFHFSAKDNLCARDFQARAGSLMSEATDHRSMPPYQRLRERDAVGKDQHG